MPSDPQKPGRFKGRHFHLTGALRVLNTLPDMTIETRTMRNRSTENKITSRSFRGMPQFTRSKYGRTPLHRRVTAAVASIAMLAHALVPAYAQSVVVDTSRPGHAAGLVTAPNGVPVVNIVAPNGAGLSHNRFTRFNVGPRGLVLNNSKTFGTSRLAGVIFGNPNLQGGTARTILGEVTGATRSELRGMQEVFGDPADYILVNSNGITCNGCGFINIPRATLSTGDPVFNASGALTGLSVNQGQITIGTSGVDATGSDYFDIVARAIEINGAINGKPTGELGLYAGRNDFDLQTRNAIAKASNGSAAPAFGIDSSALGGMYAGRITVVGTEAGVGVRAPEIGAGSGGVRIDSAGNLVLRNTTSRGAVDVQAATNIQATANTYAQASLRLQAGTDIELLNGTVTGATGNVRLEAIDIAMRGQVLAAGLASNGIITAGLGSMDILASGDLSIVGAATLAAGANLTASTATRLINNGTLSANGTIRVTAAGLTNNGTMAADGQMVLNLAGDLLNNTGRRIVGVAATTIDASTITNDGTLASDAALSLNSRGTIANSATGLISATTSGTIAATGQVTNDGTIQSLGSLDVTAARLDNTKDIAANTALALTTTGALTNAVGATVRGGDTLDLNAGSITSAGLVESAAAMTFAANTINLSGDVYSATDATFAVAGAMAITASGQVVAGRDLGLTADSLLNDGSLGSQRDLTLSLTTGLTNNASILAQGNAAITSGTTFTQGAAARMAANGTLDVSADTLTNAGILEAAGAFTIATVTNLTNSGRIEGFDALTINDPGAAAAPVTADINNTGIIRSADDLTVWANEFINANTLESAADMALTLTGQLSSNTAASAIIANGTLTVDALSIDQANQIEAGGDVTINLAGNYSQRSGGFLVAGGALAMTADIIGNLGVMLGNTDTTLSFNELHNNGGLIGSFADMELRGLTNARSNLIINSNGGTIETVGGGDLTIRTNDLQNRSTVNIGTVTSSFNNAYIAGMNTPGWVPNVFPACPSCYWQMVNDSPSGHVFIPHPDEIQRILALNNATAAQWNPHWWLIYGPQRGGPYDPTMWTAVNPDEDAAARHGDMLTVHITEEVVTSRGPVSQILSSGNLTIDGGVIVNRHSVLSAAGNMHIDGLSLDNSGAVLHRTVWLQRPRPGRNRRGILRTMGWFDQWMLGHEVTKSMAPTVIGAVPGVIEAGGNITGTLSGGITNNANPVAGGALSTLSLNASTVTTGTVGATGAALPIASLTPLSPGTTPFGALAGPLAFNSAADLGLGGAFQYFNAAPPTSPYLYETRFRFIDPGTFFGSNYFLGRVGVSNLNDLPKRLGDAYFDTRMINDQIFRTTGRRWIDIGVPDERQQMRTLIDAAAAQSTALQLTPGVALTKDQIERLTANIVWYETITVGGQEVLAPRLYIAPSNLKVPNGALIAAGGDVSLTGSEITNTRGAIEAGGALSLVSLSGDIANRSGRIRGGDVSLVSAGSIINETLTTTTGNGTNLIGTIVDRTALIEATGTLNLDAADALSIRGADLNAQGNLTLDADTVEITTVETHSLNEWGDAQNGGRNEERRNIASNINAGGNLAANADDTITIKGSNVTAKGDGSLVAGGGIDITAAEDFYSRTSSESKSGFLSKSYVYEHEEGTQLQSSSVTFGGNGTITAGTNQTANLDITASSVLIDGNGTVSASGDVNLLEGRETASTSSIRRKSGFYGGVKGGTATFGHRKTSDIVDTQSDTAVTSVLAFGGNGTITAGQDITSNAGIIGAGEDLTLNAGRDITLNSVTDLFASQESHKVRELSVSVGVYENVSGPLKALADTPRMAQSGKGGAGMKAISAVSAGLKAYDSIKSLQSLTAGGDVAGVSISIGASSSKSTSQQASAIGRGGSVTAGDRLALNAGRDLFSAGTTISADSAQIDVGRDAVLTSAQSATQSQSRSSSKGVSLGVNVGVGLGGVSVSPSIGVNAQKGKSNGQSVSHANTVIDVAGALTLNVGDDATLAGAQVQAGSADVAVGGNLTVESLADTASATSSSKGGSLSLGRSNSTSFSGQSSGPGATSLGLGLNASKSDQDSVWVNGQSGIRTDGALDVTVGETTTLVGGLIGSDSGDLTLDTKSLTTSDIALKDNAMSAEGSISLNIARVDEHKNAAGQTVAADTSTSGKVQGKYANREVEGIARATIGSGTITIRDANGDGQTNTAADQAAAEQQLAAINRDLDKGIEVTSVKEEGFELYASDKSIVAAFKAGAKLIEVLGNALDRAGEGKLGKAIRGKEISPQEALRQLSERCGVGRQGNNGWNLFEWIVPSAHADSCILTTVTGEQITISDADSCFWALFQVAYNQAKTLGNVQPFAKGLYKGALARGQEHVDTLSDPVGLAKGFIALAREVYDDPDAAILKYGAEFVSDLQTSAYTYLAALHAEDYEAAGKVLGGFVVDTVITVALGGAAGAAIAKLPKAFRNVAKRANKALLIAPTREIPTWHGSGPRSGVIGLNSRSKSNGVLLNFNPSEGVEFVFDPSTSTFLVRAPSSPVKHSILADSIDAPRNQVVGGMLTRGPNGKFLTNESSGHFHQNWTPKLRVQFTETMKRYGLEFDHRAGM